MFALEFNYSDGITYSGTTLVGLYEDDVVPGLMALELNAMLTSKDREHCEFVVTEYPVTPANHQYTNDDLKKVLKDATGYD